MALEVKPAINKYSLAPSKKEEEKKKETQKKVAEKVVASSKTKEEPTMKEAAMMRVAAKLDSGLNKLKQDKPELKDVPNDRLKSWVASNPQVQNELVNRGYVDTRTLKEVPKIQESNIGGEGKIKKLALTAAAEIAKPFVKIAGTASKAIETNKLLKEGRTEEAYKASASPIKIGLYGTDISPAIEPLKTPKESGYKATVKDILGTSIEAGMNLPVGIGATKGLGRVALSESAKTIGKKAISETAEGVGKKAYSFWKGAGEAVKAGTAEGASFGFSRALQEDKGIKETAVSTGLGAGIGSVAGIAGVLGTKALSKTAKAIAYPLKDAQKLSNWLGERITANTFGAGKREMQKGFKYENIVKHGIKGESLGDVIEQTQGKITEGVGKLREMYGNIKDIDLNKAITSSIEEIKNAPHESAFKNTALENAAKEIKRDIERMKKSLVKDEAGNIKGRVMDKAGKVSGADAWLFKKQMGQVGEFLRGESNPDLSAQSTLANKIYEKLSEEIAKKAPKEMVEVNQMLSDLIPIQQTVLNKLPKEMKKDLLNYGDIISLAIALKNPEALTLMGIKKLSKMPRLGVKLLETGKKLETKADKSSPELIWEAIKQKFK